MIYCMGCMEEIDESNSVCPHCGFEQTNQNPTGLLPIGTVLQGRYIVGRSIGNGGFGVTYIGLDGQLKRKIAIKEFFPNKLAGRMEDNVNVTVNNGDDLARFQNGLEQFLNEAKHLARLSHIQGIVYIYNYFHENGTGYIIMEYLEGTDLRNLLKAHGGKLPWEEAKELVLSVLFILRNVHMNGILHRDIAPDNVFVTTDKVVKLIDFGAARHATRGADDSAEILLKIGYAPVEQYSLDGKQGAWTDMYEVGALFYRMITGVKPIASIDRVQEDKLPIPSEMGIAIPADIEAAIMTSLNVDSRYRIQNARDYMEALGGENFRPTEWTVETTVFEGDIEVKSKFFTKKRIALLASACVLILALGVGVAVKMRKDVSVVTTNLQMQDLTGMSEETAKQTLEYLGVSNVSVLYVYDEAAEEKVTYQNPESGTSISQDVAVTITIASKEYITLPKLESGKSYEDLKEEFAAKGITVTKTEDYSDTEAKGMVVTYGDRTAGEVVNVSDEIQLIVSLGKESDYEVEVPQLVGLTGKEAQETCEEQGIPLQKISKGKNEYIVEEQSVSAEKVINVREDKLTLTLKKPEPEVTREEEEEQESIASEETKANKKSTKKNKKNKKNKADRAKSSMTSEAMSGL